MNKFRIYIGGVGCVGKTTIAKELAHRHRMEHFSGSQIMMKLCGVKSREKLSHMPKEQKMIIERTEYPYFVTQNQRVIIDGHCELLPEQAKCFDRFIYLTAPAKIIKERREQKGEKRWGTSTRRILMEQKEYLLRIHKTEQECRIKFVIIPNIGNITETCGLTEKMIKWE